MMKNIIACILILFSNQTLAAWDGHVSGKIARVDVTSGNNYGFRVILSGSPKLCGNEHAWAYINESDSNYAVYVSVLLAAKAASQTVTLYVTRKGGAANGYCHIGYIAVT